MSSSSERGKLRPSGESSRARAGWRKPASAGSGGPSRYWTQRQERGLEQETVNRIKLIAYAVTLLVLVAVFVAYLLFRPRPVPLAALIVTDYRSPLSPNALAAEDARRLEAAFGGYRNIRFSSAREGRDGHWKAILRSQLQRARAGGPGNGRLFPDNDVVLLYLSAHGVVDSQARPCLLMSGSDPLDERTWVPLLELVAYVNEFTESSRKVLLLDGGRIRENWPAGILHNGFADALQHALQAQPIERWFVLNSTRRDQRAHAAPELGGSVYAWFVAAGLRGAADANQDKRVSLRELYDYLQNHVDSWARQNRSERQRPLLIPEDAADFGLTYVTDYQRPTAEPLPADPEREGTIDRLWARYARLEQAGFCRTAPLDCALVPRDLARLEALNLAGEAYDEQFRASVAAVELALDTAEADPLAQRLPLPSASIVLQQRLGQITESEIEAARSAFSKWQQKPEGQPSEPVTTPYPAACAAVWRHVLEQARGNPQQPMEAALRFLQTTPNRSIVPVKEIALLGLLREHLDWEAAGTFAWRAIQAQDAAERSAVPADVRSHYWIRQQADAAENDLRRAWDELFVGDSKALAEADRRWTQLIAEGTGGQFGEIARVDQLVSDAYATRDQTCHAWPHLAQWLLTYPELPDRAQLVDTLLELGRKNRELAAALDRPLMRDGSADTESLSQLHDRVRSRLDALQGRYHQVCGALSVAEAGSVRATLGRIASVLEIPLVTEQREDLRHKFFANLVAKTEIQDRGIIEPAEDSEAGEERLAWLTDLELHPALAVLDRTHVVSAEERVAAVRTFEKLEVQSVAPEQARWLRLKRLAEMGGEIRTRLTEIEDVKNRLAAKTEERLSAGDPPSPPDARQGLARADLLVRSAAGLLRGRSWRSSDEDPSQQLRRLDWNYFLLWQGARVAEDFWGPVRGESSSFFAASGREYLNAARQLYGAARTYQDPLSHRLAGLDRAAASWRPLVVGDVDAVEGESLVRHQLEVQDTANVPPGEAAVFIRWAGGDWAPLVDVANQQPLRRRLAVVGQAASPQALEHLFRNDADRPLSGIMEAVALYRGHVRTSSFSIGQESPAAVVAYRRPDFGPPRIRVKGDSTQKTQIIFLLDCSGSMKERIAVEGQQTQTRLQIARSRLQEVLNSLDEDTYQVGLILYGHRAGWEEYQRGRYRTKWRSPADERRKLHPAEDVELVVPVRPIKFADVDGHVRDVRDVIAAKLDDLIPYGETPLYLAIIEALKSFNRDLPGPRHIVVITDGVNEQTADGAPQNVIKGRSDVQQALTNPLTRAQIDIIGFDLKPEFRNEEERQRWISSRDDLIRIARDPLSQGEFHEARDPSSLVEKLRNSLRLVKFFVYRDGLPPPLPEAFLDLNQPWTVQDFQREAGYHVALAGHTTAVSERVRLEGGESLLLVFNPAANRLEHLRFNDELRASKSDLRNPRQLEQRFFVGAHLPQRRAGTEVWFRISVQNAAAHLFSPRPRQIWAEIRPLPAGKQVFYVGDPEFEPDQPVPVLRLRVSPWPLEAQRAEIRFWFAMKEGTGSQSFDVHLEQPTVIDLPGATLRAETQPGDANAPYQILVMESHPGPASGYPLRLQLRPPPDFVSHSYFEEAAKVRHLFALTDRSFWKQERPKLLVTPVRQPGVLDDWISTGPLEVDLPRR